MPNDWVHKSQIRGVLFQLKVNCYVYNEKKLKLIILFIVNTYVKVLDKIAYCSKDGG